MPRRHGNASSERRTQYRSRVSLTSGGIENRKPPMPLNARDISREALGFLIKADVTHKERLIARKALEQWANPKTPELSKQFWAPDNTVALQLDFYRKLTILTHSDLLAFAVAKDTDTSEIFSPVPQGGLRLADQMLANALGDNLRLLPELEKPLPITLALESEGLFSFEPPVRTPFDNRLAEYSSGAISAYNAHLTRQTLVRVN